jgi:hypothetical protein
LASKHTWTFLIIISLTALVGAGCKDELPELSVPQPESPVEPVDIDALTAPEPTVTLKPPHDGHLLLISDDRGFIEWDDAQGRLYFLDNEGKPLSDLTEVTLHLDSPDGPEPIELTRHLAPDWPSAYRAANATPDPLADPERKGVLRFDLAGEPARVIVEQSPRADAATKPDMPNNTR